MPLYSPLDDFMERTVAHIPGLLPKLEYLSALRAADGGYEHWGMMRVFGDEAAQQAIKHAHCDLFLRVLRTPMRELLEDAQAAAERSDVAAEIYVNGLNAAGERLLPEKLGGGSARHFNSVLETLSYLVRNRLAATHRAS